MSLYPSPQVFAERLETFMNKSVTWILGALDGIGTSVVFAHHPQYGVNHVSA